MTRRIGADFSRRAGRKMSAEIEHRDLAATGEHRVDIVLDHDGGDFPLADEVAQVLKQAQRLDGRKTGARLVHQQKLRASDQRKRDIDAALHAIGDATRFLVEIVGQVHDLDHIVEPSSPRCWATRRKLLVDGEVLENAGALERSRHAVPAPPRHRAARDVLAAIAHGRRRSDGGGRKSRRAAWICPPRWGR